MNLRFAIFVCMSAFYGAATPCIIVGNETADRPTLAELRVSGAKRSSLKGRESRETTVKNPQPNLKTFRKEIRPLLQAACFHCHGPDAQEGGFRVDALDPDLIHGEDAEWWLDVVDVLSNGEMPPPDESVLGDDDLAKLIDWLSTEIQRSSQVRRSEGGHSSFRRMTRYEYNYALQDLLGLPYDFAIDLPPETASEDGFTNSSEVLQMSAMQLSYYRSLSRNALWKATVRGDRPQPVYYSVSMQDASTRQNPKTSSAIEKIRETFKDNPERLAIELKKLANKSSVRGNVTRFVDLRTGAETKYSWQYRGARYAWTPSLLRPEIPSEPSVIAIIPARQNLIVELGDQVPDSGTLRVRIRAARRSIDNPDVPSIGLRFGWQASNNSSASEKLTAHDTVIDALPGAARFYQWDIPLSEIKVRNPMRRHSKMGDTPSPSEYLLISNHSVGRGDVQIDHVEVISPFNEQWPPKSHERIFFESKREKDESAYAREILAAFMTRAWRRTITDGELNQKLRLFSQFRGESEDFQEAMIEVLSTVLSSPHFLYVALDHRTSNEEDLLSDFDLATRLSMFLWCSIPDTELFGLAESGELRDPEILVEQVNRMLADDRSDRFVRQFVRGWLGMQLLDFLNVDKKAYPQFDVALKESMQQEPAEFFREVLTNNLSVLDFIHADYALVNERLAIHYGLKNVSGNHFRRVALEPTDNRGGMMTQAGLLAMNSDGKDSHPLKRGIWMLERLLNDPPPPPPPAVPEIDLADPEIAKLTLKERMEDHRNDPACMSCHSKIDPWGIAFENFDAVGRWREKIGDRPVDSSSVLFNQQKLDGIDGLKRFLLSNRQDQFVRAMVYKMMTFALGRPLSFRDRSSIDRIAAKLRKEGDGLETLVKLIVANDLFLSK